MSETLGHRIAATLRTTAQAYASGDQIAPCAVLWTDPDRLWQGVMPKMQALMPELFVLGPYAPDKHTGPALWLRCIEARVVNGAPLPETKPVFYLPGISREQLRAVEDCPQELAALVELQFRGVMWLHVNGKEWTPYGFLVSKHGGMDLDVAKDQTTLDALAGALPTLIDEPLPQLQGRRLDADYFNALMAPDATGMLLRWLNEPEEFKQRRGQAEWKAFCQQCKSDFHFDPVKDGALKAAQLLAQRGNHWKTVWQRFAEAPQQYRGVVSWLRRAAPKQASMFDSAEVWPDLNEREERQMLQALEALLDRQQNEVIHQIAELEAKYREHRSYVWQKLGMSPFATALEPLARLAKFCASTPGAPTAAAFADFYASQGWRVDAAALAAMALPGSQEQHGPILGIVRALYLPWLDQTARHLQQLIRDNGSSVSKRYKPLQPAPGRLILFADGLRMDVAQQLADRLENEGFDLMRDWEWSAIPSVTATAKPATSPLATFLEGGEADDEFATRLASSHQRLTQDRFVAALKERGWQVVRSDETGDPSGSAWTEYGSLDKRGHNEGWKLARSVAPEVHDLASRIGALMQAGWTEVIVVTDHGWLLVPGGLPKVELKSFLAQHRWGRCAALKDHAQPDVPTFKWHWNPHVTIASPAGAGCFRASMEYSHGGVSLQEMVTPRLRVSRTAPAADLPRLVEAKWTGAKCRIVISGQCSGLRVDIRTTQSDASTFLLSEGRSGEVAPEGKATVFLEDDADIGKQADVVLLDATGQVIDARPTTLGE